MAVLPSYLHYLLVRYDIAVIVWMDAVYQDYELPAREVCQSVRIPAHVMV